ncbi:MAG: RNA polymerase sigma factor [Sphingobacteriales bacterium]|nr:MAG: RNA polymerase sigma factor [Sphingobacteriales bacterium]
MTAADFNHLVVRHSDYLRPYAISLTQNYEDARDLYQETMLRALLNKEKYQFGTNLKAWLYTIMRNIFINAYRRNKKLIKVSSDSSEELPLTADYVAHNEGWTNIRMGEIKKAIDGLPSVFRLSFELHYTGYKYQEIADLLHEPLGTIKSRIHFARKMLVTQLER